MKKIYTVILLFSFFAFQAASQSLLNCDFTVSEHACINQEILVTYTGGASANANYLWNFDGATIISGTGSGPYFVKWADAGEKHITLTINFEGHTCTAPRLVVVVELPTVFHITGGGVYIPGTAGVNVGLTGSQAGIIYKLRLNGQYTGVVVQGTGQAISFGPQAVPGHYTAVARLDGSDCMREMEGVAVVTENLPPMMPYICMVTFDTTVNKNKVIWNKHQGNHVAHYNVFRETYQNNVFAKIGEVPYANLSVYVDPTSDPLVKSDRFRISGTDSAGHESEKSPFHKTIHLNINPGISGFNLIWNHYEGFEFHTYRIHRKHETGAWEVIDSIASNVDSYTDLYSGSGVMTYFIEVVRTEPCTPSLKSDEFPGVISNTASAAPLGVKEGALNGILLYPNPVGSKLNLALPGNNLYHVDLIRPDGVTLSRNTVNGPKAEINVAGLANGLYILRIADDNGVVLRKFLKNQ